MVPAENQAALVPWSPKGSGLRLVGLRRLRRMQNWDFNPQPLELATLIFPLQL